MTKVGDIYPSDRVVLREVGLRDGLQLVKKFPSTSAKQRWVRDEYAAVKSRLASTYAGDRERYTDEKAAFVTRVMRDLDAASDKT